MSSFQTCVCYLVSSVLSQLLDVTWNKAVFTKTLMSRIIYNNKTIPLFHAIAQHLHYEKAHLEIETLYQMDIMVSKTDRAEKSRLHIASFFSKHNPMNDQEILTV